MQRPAENLAVPHYFILFYLKKPHDSFHWLDFENSGCKILMIFWIQFEGTL